MKTTAHNPQKRRKAAAVPLVLFGDFGRTVEGYRPADEDLVASLPAQERHFWVPVGGPHLRVVRSRDRRSKTGIVGVSLARRRSTGRHYVVANLGSTNRCFCIETLGKTEAWRRAIALRREHLKKLMQANEVILRARAANAAAGSNRGQVTKANNGGPS